MNAGPSDHPALHRARTIKYAFLVLLFVQLFLDTYYPDLARQPSSRLLTAMLGGLFALAWAHADGQARGREVGLGMRIGLVLLAGAFVPAWLFQTRPPEQAWRALGRFVLWLLALVFGFSLGVSVLAQRGIAPVLPATG